jgi:hypothetical protein
MDLTKSSSQWCNARSKESDNVAVFWESGFGSDPSSASGSYRVNMTTLLQTAEKAYAVYQDSLKFAIRGSSVADKNKLVIFLLYTTTWTANGSGEDEVVGTLRVDPAAANINVVVAHEMGHCFEYITGCDDDGGYRYGFGTNGQGGNGFWEQCANWMAFKVFPEREFTESDFGVYVKSNHLHILHETPRYANYFLPDYWTFKRGKPFMASLWRDSRSPEDPVETYKRLNSLSQPQFNDEMYEHASRLTTWDIPDIKSYGEKYIDNRPQVKMNATSDNFWLIDTSACIQNYGYNSIKLNAPSQAAGVSVRFMGKTGASGFRVIKTDKGGWRVGFVALLKDGTRKYGDVAAMDVQNGKNPDSSLAFSCPANCSKLWFVVSGAPQEHWRHPWDDNTANDEQWPYQVQFKNTNLLGKPTTATIIARTDVATQLRPVVSAQAVRLPAALGWQIADAAGRLIASGHGNVIDMTSFPNGAYILHYSGKRLKLLRCGMHTANR